MKLIYQWMPAILFANAEWGKILKSLWIQSFTAKRIAKVQQLIGSVWICRVNKYSWLYVLCIFCALLSLLFATSHLKVRQRTAYIKLLGISHFARWVTLCTMVWHTYNMRKRCIERMQWMYTVPNFLAIANKAKKPKIVLFFSKLLISPMRKNILENHRLVKCSWIFKKKK